MSLGGNYSEVSTFFIMQHSNVAFPSVFLMALPSEEAIKLTGAESNLSCVYCVG